MDSQPTRMATPLTDSTTAISEEERSTRVIRVLKSVSRAFDSISPTFASVTIWNMMVTQKFGLTDIADRPSQFIQALRGIYDESQVRLIEAKLVNEI